EPGGSKNNLSQDENREVELSLLSPISFLLFSQPYPFVGSPTHQKTLKCPCHMRLGDKEVVVDARRVERGGG
ncbi:MAG: hypothetical protein WBZ42_10665, partial [Halobacteriota archaeon]